MPERGHAGRQKGAATILFSWHDILLVQQSTIMAFPQDDRTFATHVLYFSFHFLSVFEIREIGASDWRSETHGWDLGH